MRLTHFALPLAALLASPALLAQETPAAASETAPLTMPASSSSASTPAVPKRGATMASVREKFGAPTQEQPAVGNPPITRWDYPGYSVFFESDKVLHTVLAAAR